MKKLIAPVMAASRDLGRAVTAGEFGRRSGSTIAACTLALLLSGCSHVSTDHFPRRKAEAATIRPAMQRKNEIIFLSSPEMDANKPVLLLLHGATEDPMEMMDIAREWQGTYNVLLYSYNFHRPIKTIAADLVREMNTLHVRLETLRAQFTPVQNLTVVTYSYSAAIFRKAVQQNKAGFVSARSIIVLLKAISRNFINRPIGRYCLVSCLHLQSPFC